MNIPAASLALAESNLADLRSVLRSATHRDEAEAVAALLEACSLTSGARHRIVRRARDLVEAARAKRDHQGSLDAFLQEFGLSNREGVALMCLAEALLRVPDTDTADKLIAEKIRSGVWADHRGRSDSLFVNASTWALMLTGRVIDLDRDTREDLSGWFSRLVGRTGEPVIRSAVNQAMRIMGGQFVLGRTIEEAISRARKANPKGVVNSFDMLGEGARTDAAASRYFEEYLSAIRAIGKLTTGETVYDRHGISVKLSALHPRYEFKEAAIVMAELLPRLKDLALAAKEENLGFNIDAEEAGRLDLSLDLFEALARDPKLAGWDGLGFVVQAYQKRGPHVIDWLAALGRETGRRFMVRLVKGAYWDTEIKHAQERGLADYPVYTRKASTDLSYLVCAARMLDAPDALYAQFATHNAHSVAAILEMTGVDDEQGGRDFEFQRLHGMGELLYDGVRKSAPDALVRIYSPVGQHKDLLPYLVRRLLENGANSSFVNRFMDARTPVEDLVKDPVALVEAAPPRHANIPVPRDIYRASGLPRTDRDNARGIDLDDPVSVASLLKVMEQARARDYLAVPVIGGVDGSSDDAEPVTSPADRAVVVGRVRNATSDEVTEAARVALEAQKGWDSLGGAARADILARAADMMEAETENLMALITAEAGRTIDDALDEVREAVDFLRYYAEGARTDFAMPEALPGPTGEANSTALHGRGVFACISPWNFPLAIFTGQVSAALAAGNAVLAKPADQTPLIGREAVRILHDAGVPGEVLHFLPGRGAVGAAMVASPPVTGVAFTGSTETAQIINRTLAGRDGPIPTLIAETGGQNAMIVDSTALSEQVVDDAVLSAFRSAGQRCSALRVLFLQEDIAGGMIEMLSGAMDALMLGDPAQLETDVGPVIDEAARDGLTAHVERMKRDARLIKACPLPEGASEGSFIAPHMFEIESLDMLEREVFGPILHVVRYKARDLPKILESIKRTRYGLTLGIHSRIESTAEEIFNALGVGNTYVNRNMVGAIVGVQPFGGQGLSGTGPKAGGPRYLHRFATEKTLSINTTATGGNAALFCLTED
jgi:RHH-type proline utilization regulon transcriptional repressor/proline dehydrogenase/delta 1-pyrroline-5-carboxylate dehydrogenase